MRDISLVVSSLRARALGTVLSVFLTAFGVMMAVIVLMFTHHVESRMKNDGKGFDLVLGAKGSPLQIVLSSIYHIDIPTGNIPYAEAQKWMRYPQVKEAIPLALGDNYRGLRIVGSTPLLIEHYNSVFAQGRIWDELFEVVVGANVGLSLGDEFSGAHGLVGEGHAHDEKYVVVGVLKPTGRVIDRLIITSLDSVLEIHGHKPVSGHHHEHADHGHSHHDHDGDHNKEAEITAVLLKLKSPLAAMNLPPMINRTSVLQAANPALEMARLSSMLGVGTRSLGILSSILIAVSALSIFAGLAGGFQSRAHDLAVLRALGYARGRLFRLVLCEGLLISAIGLFSGLIMAMAGSVVFINMTGALKESGAVFMPDTFILLPIVISVFLAGGLSAIIPAWRAARINVAEQLAKGT